MQRYLTRKEVAERLNCSVRTVDRLRKDGILPWVDVSAGRGNKPLVRFRDADLAALEARYLQDPMRKAAL